MTTIDDIIIGHGWDADDALRMSALLEELIAAIWRARGAEMSARLKLAMAAREERARS